jgi:hypothetical protein
MLLILEHTKVFYLRSNNLNYSLRGIKNFFSKLSKGSSLGLYNIPILGLVKWFPSVVTQA